MGEKENFKLMKIINKTAKNAVISIFLLSPLLSGEPREKNYEEKTPAIKKTDQVPKPKYFFDVMKEKDEKKRKMKRMINSILNSRDLTASEALKILEKIDMPRHHKEKAESLLKEIARLENEGKIRTMAPPPIVLKEENDEKMKEKLKEIKRIPHVVTITYYPEEDSIVIHFLTDLKTNEMEIKKGKVFIIDKKGINSETSESDI